MRRFIQFCGGRHPRELGAVEITTFLTHLAVDLKVASSTQNQALQSLLFLYRDVLQLDLPHLTEVVRATRPPRLPVVLSRDEVRRIFSHLHGGSRPRTCSNRARTSARCRNCWATPACRRR